MRLAREIGRTWMLAAACALALLGALAVFASDAHADVDWLCHPGMPMSADPCEAPLDTTTLGPGDAQSVSTPARPPEPRRPVDCFYVYPTVSNQIALNASRTAPDAPVRAVTTFQAARFSTGCRMFAPLYRQATALDVAGNVIPHGPLELAYSDVLAAWKDYLAHDNDGRGVILIGHSQGSILLRQLIRTQIDPDPAARRLLVGAVLLGGNVTTRAGRTTGGDFQHVPLCTRRGEFGCVVAYSTYDADPLPATLFGNTNTDALSLAFGEHHGPGYQVACTDPGTLSGLTGPFGFTIPTAPFPHGLIGAGISILANGPLPRAATTWVRGGQYAGSCQTINGAHVFRYRPLDGSRRFNQFPPLFGTHLIDFNLGTRRLTTIAHLPPQAWLRARFGVGAAHRHRRRGSATLRAAVPGAGALEVKARRRIRPRRTRVTAPGTVALRVSPTRRLRRQLQRRGHRSVRVHVIYTPTGGERIVSTERVRLVLQPRPRRGRHHPRRNRRQGGKRG